MDENEKFDWSNYASIRAPRSVVKQLDAYKEKCGYTSRPQAIIAAIERAEKSNLVEEIQLMLDKFFEEKGETMVRKALIEIVDK